MTIPFDSMDIQNPVTVFEQHPTVRNFKAVPKNQQTADMVERLLTVLQENTDSIFGNVPAENRNIARYISKRLLTPEICKQISVLDPTAVSYLPKKLLTYELCMELVAESPRSIRWVPVEYRNQDLWHLAVHKQFSLIASMPIEYQTQELFCEAFEMNIDNFRYVPEKYQTVEMCLQAVTYNGLLLKHVKSSFRTSKICLAAVISTPLAIEYIPRSRISKRIAQVSIEGMPDSDNDSQYHELTLGTGELIHRFPIFFFSKKLATVFAKQSIEKNYTSIRDIDETILTIELCQQALDINVRSLSYFPQAYRHNDDLIDYALHNNIDAIQYIVPEDQTHERCDYVRKHSLQSQWEALLPYMPSQQVRPSTSPICDSFDGLLRPVSDTLPEIMNTEMSVAPEPTDNAAVVHELAQFADITNELSIYYISDLHLEHQFTQRVKNFHDVRCFCHQKAEELVSSMNRPGLVLIAGDTANSVDIANIFYSELTDVLALRFSSTVRLVAVLGNHELWDGNPDGYEKRRMLDDVIADYQAKQPRVILENELLVLYKGRRFYRFSEHDIMRATNEELTKLCQNSSIIILGGLGFSGLNPKFNAATGIYRMTVSPDEDCQRTQRFQTVYHRIEQVACEKSVIVLTHTPIWDWLDTQCNCNWIYINGHTHQNSLIRLADGTTVLADNQIGYDSRRYVLNRFTIAGRWDPFATWGDGSYTISAADYVEFNCGRGIHMSKFGYLGTIKMLKENNIYMFFLESDRHTLCILSGGQRHRATHDLEYYRANLVQYFLAVKKGLQPYRQRIEQIASEVRAIGGFGTIHGCIVDIDFYNHIYLNPYDGTITPYFAWDMDERIIYTSLAALLEQSPSRTLSNSRISTIQSAYNQKITTDEIGLIKSTDTNVPSVTLVSDLLLDRTIYEPSRIMRAIQYVFDQNVVRIWNDEILTSFQEIESNETASSDGSTPRLE